MLPAAVPASNYLRRIDMPYERYILDAMAVFDEQDRRDLYGSDFAELVRNVDPYEHQLPNFGGSDGRGWEARMMEYDLKTYLPNDVLTKVDRMSMRASIEARVPLLDHHLVEFAARIPSRLKIRGGVSKSILKRVMAPYLPAEVLHKRKQGFSVPLGTWLRTDLKQDIMDALRGGNRHGLFDARAVERLTDAFFRGDDSRNYQVWTLYAFELWYRNVHGAAARDRRSREAAPVPLVSIVIPAFNAERHIAETLGSIAAQSLRDFEVVVVDDGSTDGTVDTVFQFADRLPLVVHRQPNAGPAAARNRGIRAARGRYCAFLDSDDLMLPERLAAQVEVLAAQPDLGLVHTDLMTFDDRGVIHHSRRAFSNPCGGMVLDRLLMDNFITTSTVMAPTSRLVEAGLFGEGRRISEDFELWLRMAARWPIAYVDRPLVQYRRRPGSLSDDKLTTAQCALEVIQTFWSEHPAQRELQPEVYRRSVADHLATAGTAALDRGLRGQAWRYTAQSLRLDPWRPRAWKSLVKTLIAPTGPA